MSLQNNKKTWKLLKNLGLPQFVLLPKRSELPKSLGGRGLCLPPPSPKASTPMGIMH